MLEFTPNDKDGLKVPLEKSLSDAAEKAADDVTLTEPLDESLHPSLPNLRSALEYLEQFPLGTDLLSGVVTQIRDHNKGEELMLCERWLSATQTLALLQASSEIEQGVDPLKVYELAGEISFILDFADVDVLLCDRIISHLAKDREMDRALINRGLEVIAENLSSSSSSPHGAVCLKNLIDEVESLAEGRFLFGYLSAGWKLAGEIAPRGFREVIGDFIARFTMKNPERMQLIYGEHSLPAQMRFLRAICSGEDDIEITTPVIVAPPMSPQEQTAHLEIILSSCAPEVRIDGLEKFLGELIARGSSLTIENAFIILNDLPRKVNWGRSDLSSSDMLDSMARAGHTRWAPSPFEPVDRTVLWLIARSVESSNEPERLRQLLSTIVSKLKDTHGWEQLKVDFRVQFERYLSDIVLSKIKVS